MRIFCICIIFLLTHTQCKQESPLPIPPSQLIEVLADIHLAEAAAQSLPLKTKDTTLTMYYKQVFEIHDVSQQDFDSTMVILKSKPKWLKAVYEKVIETIDQRKATVGR